MATKLSPQDVKTLTKTATLNGKTYSYILSEPKDSKPLNTILLVHGFPDMAFGWRYQIPHLTSLGLRVIVPDMIGYGGTDAPEDEKEYTFKKTCDDLAELLKVVGVSSVILGGHDWGGAVVYRMAIYYPHLLTAVFSVCTPFMPPATEYRDMADRPNFRYQAQLRGPDLVSNVKTKEKIGQLLAALYGAPSKDKKPAFTVDHGCHFDRLDGLGKSPLVSDEEIDFYAAQYSRNGLRGPTNWYRTGELNFNDEKHLADPWAEGKERFEMPFLFISAKKDAALPPASSEKMDRYFRSLTRGQVDATHWALWEKPQEVNQYLEEWIMGTVGRKASHI